MVSLRAERIAVIGDIGGQLGSLKHQLVQLGVDPLAPEVPAGLLIVQVGDLVSMTGATAHSNRETVELASELLTRNPERYVQLLGNHELGALGGSGRPGWTGAADPELESLLKAVVFKSALGIVRQGRMPLLLSHAGVTPGRWESLGRPDLPTLVRKLNQQVPDDLMSTRRPGRLVTGVTDPSADEQWAEVNYELYGPWLKRPSMPWVQIHGHASPWSWGLGGWWPDTPAEIRNLTRLEPASRISRTGNDTTRFISVNWELTDRDGETDGAPLIVRLRPRDRVVI